jgi:hypothetical protein
MFIKDGSPSGNYGILVKHHLCTGVSPSKPSLHCVDPLSSPLQTTQNQDNAELFVNCLEAMVETCLPGDDLDVQNPYPSSLGIASHLNLSSSMSSLSMGSLHSPTDKDSGAAAATASSASAADLASVAVGGAGGGASGGGGRMRHGSASSSHVQPKMRVGSFKRKNSSGGGSKKKPPPDGFE